jgi:hypothetical protein
MAPRNDLFMKAITITGTAALITSVEGTLRPPKDALGVFLRSPKRGTLPPLPRTGAEDSNALELTIYRVILKPSLGQQFRLLFLTLVPFLFLYFSSDPPKITANRTIISEKFSEMIGEPEEEFAAEGSWVLYQASFPQNFSHVIVLRDGKLEEQGNLSELEGNVKLLSGPAAAERRGRCAR